MQDDGLPEGLLGALPDLREQSPRFLGPAEHLLRLARRFRGMRNKLVGLLRERGLSRYGDLSTFLVSVLLVTSDLVGV